MEWTSFEIADDNHTAIAAEAVEAAVVVVAAAVVVTAADVDKKWNAVAHT